MVLPRLLAGRFLAGQLIAAEMESLETEGLTVWLYVWAVLGFPFAFYSMLLQCSLEKYSQDLSLNFFFFF